MKAKESFHEHPKNKQSDRECNNQEISKTAFINEIETKDSIELKIKEKADHSVLKFSTVKHFLQDTDQNSDGIS